MVLTDEQRKTLIAATDEAVKWLNENAHPHVIIVVNQNSVEVLEGVERHINNDHLKD